MSKVYIFLKIIVAPIDSWWWAPKGSIRNYSKTDPRSPKFHFLSTMYACNSSIVVLILLIRPPMRNDTCQRIVCLKDDVNDCGICSSRTLHFFLKNINPKLLLPLLRCLFFNKRADRLFA